MRKEKNKRFICINCTHCVYTNNEKTKVFCDMGYFKSVDIKKAMFFSPVDFDCIEYIVD